MICMTCSEKMVQAQLVSTRRTRIWLCTGCGRQQTRADAGGVRVLNQGRRRPVEPGVQTLETFDTAVVQGFNGRGAARPDSVPRQTVG